MQKKLTITIDEKIYEGLFSKLGAGKISNFIENLVKPYVLHQDLELAYREMALDEESFENVWDALEDNPVKAENMKMPHEFL